MLLVHTFRFLGCHKKISNIFGLILCFIGSLILLGYDYTGDALKRQGAIAPGIYSSPEASDGLRNIIFENDKKIHFKKNMRKVGLILFCIGFVMQL